MAILEKIIRIFYYPIETKLMAQAAEENAELDKIVKKASQIIDSFKKEIANDPEIQKFLKDYDSKYTIRRYH